VIEIWNEQEGQSHLLPPNNYGFTMVLFVSNKEQQREYIQRYIESVNQLEVRSVIVEVDPSGRSEMSLAGWFGLSEYPTLAAIYDGMLLAIECDCAQGSCSTVMRDAVAQYRALVSMEA